MQVFSCTDKPIEISGLYRAMLPEHFYRLPVEVMRSAGDGVTCRAQCPSGARVRFRTDSPSITVRMVLRRVGVDWAMSRVAASGMAVYSGAVSAPKYLGVVVPDDYSDEPTKAEQRFEKMHTMEDVTVFLARNEELISLEIIIEDGASIEPPTPYAISKPIVFYGSSITEGGCATRNTNSYTALLSKWLDADYINLGFSGAAKGESAVASYIASLDMCAFVYDYDHNAPDVAHLEATHEPFFQIIRECHPLLPIIMLTKPDFDSNPQDAAARREVIYRTYTNALEAGDEHVAFIDGETYFGPHDREVCTVEGCHPNDLGFMRMAQTIYPVLQRMLKTI